MRIGVIGRTAEHLCDGQTVKTRTLVSELRDHYPDSEIMVVQTYDFRRRPLRRLWELARCIRRCDVIFVLLSHNGRAVLFPILYRLNRFFGKPLLHDCIGGALDEHVRQSPRMRRYLSMFRINWVETLGLKLRLEALGVNNAAVMPNFKRLSPVPIDELRPWPGEPYRFCTFSRVIPEKGIGTAAEAVMAINRKTDRRAATLDVYGPVEPSFRGAFERLVHTSGGAVRYMGVAPPEDSVRILREFFMLLFPTTFAGEGFPGTLIDAFCAALPVIATDWHCNGEIIENGATGFLCDAAKPEDLRALMEFAMENPQRVHQMRENCLQAAEKYRADRVMQAVYDEIARIMEK